MKKTNGHVYLVGAGPGDPGLITLKGKACIENADVLVYDYLASSYLLAYAREGAEQIYVGKKGGDHTLKQHQINQLLVEKAGKGLTVARLKGGDPFIFGRGGEEVEVLIGRHWPQESAHSFFLWVSRTFPTLSSSSPCTACRPQP